MKGGSNTSGFTIIETMIVLGITTIILLSSLYVLSGKTAAQEFTQSINDIKTSLQEIINSSANGSYPNVGSTGFSCSQDPSTGYITTSPGNSPGVGANQDCTFLGKMMDFSVSSTNGTNQQYGIYTIVGLRCSYSSWNNGECTAPTSWTDAGPYLLPPNTGTQLTQTLSNGLSINSITLIDTSNNSTSYQSSNLPDVAFLANPANQSSSPSGTGLSPGSLQLSLYGYSGGTEECPTDASGGQISPASCLIAENEIDLCFTSATTDQSGKIILNSTGYQATVSLQLYGDTTC